MKSLAILIDRYGGTSPSFLIVALVMGLVSLSVSAAAQSDANGGLSAAKTEMVDKYEAARAAGKHAAAAKYVLDFIEETEGKNAPLTVAMLQRYGNLLREEGDIRQAVSVLKTARKRGMIAFGEHGFQLFEINLDLGEAYVDRDLGVGKPKRYFDDALEVLRKNGQGETFLYVRTLVGITSRLTEAGVLEGAFSADFRGQSIEDMEAYGTLSVLRKYESGYQVLAGYMQEAVALAAVLEIEDPYMSAKIAIIQAKIKVLETLFLAEVPSIVRGSISGVTARENYQREDGHLLSAIDVLIADARANQVFLDIANSARMDIAWLSKDRERMANFCSSNTLNLAARYPPDRLFDVMENGDVIAPSFSFRIPSNIFKRLRARNNESWGPNRKSEKTPRFVPVCINGRLMAALVNSPMVSIEEID